MRSINFILLYIVKLATSLDIYINNSDQNTQNAGSFSNPYFSLNYALKNTISPNNDTVVFIIAPSNKTPYTVVEEFNIFSNLVILSSQTGVKIPISFSQNGTFLCQTPFSLVLKDIQVIMSVGRDIPQFFVSGGNQLTFNVSLFITSFNCIIRVVFLTIRNKIQH